MDNIEKGGVWPGAGLALGLGLGVVYGVSFANLVLGIIVGVGLGVALESISWARRLEHAASDPSSYSFFLLLGGLTVTLVGVISSFV